MKVLLVEDEEFIRDLFKRQLDLSGFTTDAFSNGQDGLSAITKNAYDLVLLDIMLPDINGLQILQNIRQNPATKGVAVVLLTNLGQDAVIKQGFELGADGYLVKAAYTPDQIVQEVKNIMQKKTAQAKLPVPGQPLQAPPQGEAGIPAFPGQAPATPPPDPLASVIPTPPASTPLGPMAQTPQMPPTFASNPAPELPSMSPQGPMSSSPSVPLSASEITSQAASTEQSPISTPTTEVTNNNS